MFWDYIWWYVLALAICLFVAVVHLYRTPNTYSRSAKVIVSQDGQDATMMNLMEFSGMASPRMGSSFFANNEVEAFSSHDLMEQVVTRLSLETSYTDFSRYATSRCTRTIRLKSSLPERRLPRVPSLS